MSMSREDIFVASPRHTSSTPVAIGSRVPACPAFFTLNILFTLVNVARFSGFHPETALSDAVKKFEQRFRFMEKRLSARGKSLEETSHGELEQLWGEAKTEDR